MESLPPRTIFLINEDEDQVLDPVQSHSPRGVLFKLYLSHTLSTWCSRTFEFGAVLALAAIFPGTLLYASCYALIRSAAAAVLSSWIGEFVDRSNRLSAVRHSIIWQRVPVALSCILFLVMLTVRKSSLVTGSCFVATIALACLEKLAAVGNTVAIERDWVIIVAEELNADRQDLNAVMRRIDLLCKLLAPVGISLVDSYSTTVAVWVIFGLSSVSVLAEYFAIAQVYYAVSGLRRTKAPEQDTFDEASVERGGTLLSSTLNRTRSACSSILLPWIDYMRTSVFLACFSLCLLYLTVLSFALQMTTYLLSVGFTPLQVSLMRVVAVLVELSATCVGPVVTARIGPVRAGLWFINWQLAFQVAAAIAFTWLDTDRKIAGIGLVGGVIVSRLGLWGFDLSMQYIVQEVRI